MGSSPIGAKATIALHESVESGSQPNRMARAEPLDNNREVQVKSKILIPAYAFGSVALLAFAVSPAQAAAPSSGARPIGIAAPALPPQKGEVRTLSCPGAYKLCVHLTWTSTQMAPTVTTNPAGTEISGPGVANVYECTGSPRKVCTAASLSTVGQPGSPWQLLPPAPGTTCTAGSAPCSVAQTTPSGAYDDVTGIAYGQIRNYVVTNTWTSPHVGGRSGYSSMAQVVLSAAPATAPRGAAQAAHQ